MTYYQSTTSLSSVPRLRRNQNAVRFRPSQTGLGPISNALIVGVLVSVLGLMYLTQVTKTSSYGYEVNSFNQQKEQLIEDNQALKVESARLQALDRIKTSDVARNQLTAPSEVNYAN